MTSDRDSLGGGSLPRPSGIRRAQIGRNLSHDDQDKYGARGGACHAATAFGQQSEGNGQEAKAMLVKAVAAVKADKTKALDMFNKGEGGFLDRDLYPFCFNVSDGKTVALANPHAKQLIGQDVRTNKDVTGKMFGLELYAAAQKAEGQITEVSYMFPRPNDPKAAQKVSFVTRVGDLGCGVGYYK